MKSFTSLEQSMKLSEILPLESADMTWSKETTITDETEWYITLGLDVAITSNLFSYRNGYLLPCWSLSALLSVLPSNKQITITLSRGGWNTETVEYVDKWFCEYENVDSPSNNFSVSADNPIDACYEMIIKLNELK